jgi:hypothetical protein
MNQVLLVSFFIFAALFAVYGVRLLVTGRTLGRQGFSTAETSRLHHAPPIFFRAVGALVTTLGLTTVDLTALMDFRARLPNWLIVTLQLLEALLLVALLASCVWLLRLANRYRLFRWNKP